jgi:hypothetical protein
MGLDILGKQKFDFGFGSFGLQNADNREGFAEPSNLLGFLFSETIVVVSKT